MKIEEVKKEYFRIAKRLKIEALTRSNYDSNCRQGYSTHFLKRYLKLSFNGMKKTIGAPLTTTSNNKEGKLNRGKKIHCRRGTGQIIRSSDCIPGCNDACIDCNNKQLKNIQAGSDTYTSEEETAIRHEGIRGAGYADMIAPYSEI